MSVTGLKLTNANDEDVVLPERATPEERMHPPGGWDNPADVQAAISICEGMKFYILKDQASEVRCFDLAMRMYNQGIARRTARILIKKHAKAGLQPDNIRLQIDRAYSVAHHPPGQNSLAKSRDEENDPEWMKIEEDDPDDLSWLEGGNTNWPRPVDYDTKQNNASVLRQFLELRPGKLISSDGEIFSLDDVTKIWNMTPADALAAEMRATDPSLTLDTSRLLRIVQSVHVENHTKTRPFQWIDKPYDAPSYENLAFFSNGALDVETGSLRVHDGRQFVTGLPICKYDPDAQCPQWLSFLNDTLDSSYIPTLQEFCGLLLVPDTRYQKALFMIGAKRAGKSTILNIMESLVGDQHCIARTIGDLASDFGLEGFADKRVLSIPDASDSEVSKRTVLVDRLKAIIGGDKISINRKGLRIVNERVPVRLVMAANRFPKAIDESGALAARAIIITFSRSFLGREDRELGTKLQSEISGIANWAIEGLRRLRANGGKFTIGTLGAAAVRALAESQSPALRFAKTHLTVTGDMADRAALPDVFAAYESWSVDESLGPRERRNRTDFANDLVAALGHKGVVHGKRRWHDPARPKFGKGKVVRGFFGVRLRAASVDGVDTV